MRDKSLPAIRSQLMNRQFAQRNLCLGVVVLVSLIAFWGNLTTLFRFSFEYEHYSHIVLIPLVSLGLVWMERKRVFATVHWSYRLGTALLFLGAILYTLSRERLGSLSQHDNLSLAILSLVIIWLGGFVLCYGTRAFRAATFPLFFLFLAVPLPSLWLDGIVLMLQKGSAEVSDELFRLASVPVFREGLVFALPGLNIEVAKECSGIRSSMALLVTAMLAGHLFLRSGWSKMALTLFILPVLVFKNGVRIFTIASLAIHVDRGFLTGWLHTSGGVVFFLVGLAILAALLWLLQKSEKKIYGFPGK